MIYTTLNKIRVHNPCQSGWAKLLKYLGKTSADDEPLALAVILESNGLDDALWCTRTLPELNKKWRLYAVACVRRVQHLMTDPRSLAVLDVAERHAHGKATDEELAAARAAARAAAWAATWTATTTSAWTSARAATWTAAYNDAGVAAWVAARAVAESATGDAEREWQRQEFLRVISEGEE